jgi:hypothetical protein
MHASVDARNLTVISTSNCFSAIRIGLIIFWADRSMSTRSSHRNPKPPISVILIDLASELTDESEPVSTYDAPGRGTLPVVKLKGAAPVSFLLAFSG